MSKARGGGGFTTTLFGRRRPFGDLTSTNRTLRENAERQALNSPILPEHVLGKLTAAQQRTSSFGEHPIGTGPYVVDQSGYDPTTRVVYDKKAQWWAAQDGLDLGSCAGSHADLLVDDGGRLASDLVVRDDLHGRSGRCPRS